MTKILFLIHDLGVGGAEKVLVNLVNHLDRRKFDISVIVLFGGGVNEQFLAPDIHFRAIFPRSIPGNSKLMKLLSPQQLHTWFIKEHYDIEVSYLEGPSARIISGCESPDTKLVSWIHCTMHSAEEIARPFRNTKEAMMCYGRFDMSVFVSDSVCKAFSALCPQHGNSRVLYNTNDTRRILALKDEPVDETFFAKNEVRICGIGKLAPVKGFDRLLRVHKRLHDDGYVLHTYILGEGQDREMLERAVDEYGLKDTFTLLGYQTNPYKYISRCDLYVCSSHAEGFSTAATEALIVGTPVCTVDVSGMREMLGDDNEWGIVTENSEDSLYQGLRQLLDTPKLLACYKEKAVQRGQAFRTEETVKAVEDMFAAL